MIDLADFPFTTSNVTGIDTALAGVAAPFTILEVGGADVAIIGVENIDTESLVFPGRIAGLTIEDAATSANAARVAAEEAGADVFIAVAHIGANAASPPAAATGPLMDFAEALDGFHAVIGAHSHVNVDATTSDGTVVVQTAQNGGNYAKISLFLVPYSGYLIDSSGSLVTTATAGVTPDPDVVAYLEPIQTAVRAELDVVIGQATDLYPQSNTIVRTAEAAIGDLVTDVLRDYCGDAQIGLWNGGGIRAPIPSSYAPADLTLHRTTAGYVNTPPYDIVVGDIYAVLPYGNLAVCRTITGQQLWAALNNGVSQIRTGGGRFAQVSGIRYTFNVPSDGTSVPFISAVTLADGTPIPNDADHTYTFATNDYLSLGGDGYTVLNDGTMAPGDIMADVMIDAIETAGTITPYTDGRITRTDL
jgi:5'-nucleotidase